MGEQSAARETAQATSDARCKQLEANLQEEATARKQLEAKLQDEAASRTAAEKLSNQHKERGESLAQELSKVQENHAATLAERDATIAQASLTGSERDNFNKRLADSEAARAKAERELQAIK